MSDPVSRPRSRYYMEKMRSKPSNSPSENRVSPADLAEKSSEPPATSGTSNPPFWESPSSDQLPEPEIIPLGLPIDKTKSPWKKLPVKSAAADVEKKVSDDLPEGVEEPDKLAWTLDVQPESVPSTSEAPRKSTEKGDLFEARFDPSGTILRPDSQIPVSSGLYHHGQDPDKPGYTLDEIFTLLQSASQPQKLWALGALTAILHQAKLSVYDDYLEASLLVKMSNEDMILPLRHLLDHSSVPVVCAALKTIEAILVNDVDEYMTDELLILDKQPIFFELNPADVEEEKDADATESELTDVQLMKVDVIKGFLRTAILKRFEFLLEAYLLVVDFASLSSLLAILTRIIRHSGAVALQVSQEKTLMELVTSPSVKEKCPVAQMKLVRILTSVVGPLGQVDWAEKMYHSAAGWISALRIVIDDTTVRDMVTESLNLLIVLGHYGVSPASISGIENIFPQVLHSAGPKPDGSITKWDACCCSRILTFLSLGLTLQTAGKPLISDKMAVLVMQNVLTGYTNLDVSTDEIKDAVDQMKASYLLYATAYFSGHRPEFFRLSTTLLQKLGNFFPKLLDFPVVTSKTSPVDPVGLPSYGLVQRGGQSVFWVLEERNRLSLAIQTVRFVNGAFQAWKPDSALCGVINDQLAKITRFKVKESDFWSSYYVRLLVETAILGLKCLQAKLGIDYSLLYRAGLHLVPLLGEHQAEDLKTLLNGLIFNPSLLPEKNLVGNQFGDMTVIQEVFSYLQPLGFTSDRQTPLAVPSRRVGVFTRTWMFDCYAYVLEWGVASEKVRHSSREQCLEGYFYWLVHLVTQMTSSKNAVLTPDELYVHLGDFFGEDGDYRLGVAAACLTAIMRRLERTPAARLVFTPSASYNGKAFGDLYDSALDNYEASSYADEVFTNYILLPVQQRQPLVFREKFWGPEKQIFSVVRIHHLDLCYPVDGHLEPAEQDVNLLSQYFLLLMTQSVTEKRNPLLYLICIHHLHRFLQRPSDPTTETLRKKLTVFLQRNKDAVLAKALMLYSVPATRKGDSVLDLLETVPELFLSVL